MEPECSIFMDAIRDDQDELEFTEFRLDGAACDKEAEFKTARLWSDPLWGEDEADTVLVCTGSSESKLPADSKNRRQKQL